MSENVVEMEGITKRFPGVLANDNIDFTVERGQVHTLLGENGAGKTTLMNVLYGLYQHDEGSIRVKGEAVDFDSPRQAIDSGIGMIHQHFMLVDPMTVSENIVLGNEPERWGGLGVDRKAARESVRELSEQYGFDVDPEAKIENIGVGVQQRVEILKALYRGAEILILDEPTAVLTPQEVDELFAVIDELTNQEKTVIFITHKLGEAMEAADVITVLRDGQQVGTVDPEQTSRNELAEMMVGREVMLEIETDRTSPGEPVLSVTDLHVEDGSDVELVSGISLDVRENEILGIAGVDGNGQSELVDAITGLGAPDSGTIHLNGQEITHRSRRERIEAGMAYIPEDRQERGLVMDFDLTENGLLGSQHDPDFATGVRIDWQTVRDHVDTIIEEYDVRPPDKDAIAKYLSGGNQQKFVAGRELLRDPSVIIASHPTRGLDVGSVEFVQEQLVDLRNRGKGVLLVSSKLDEVRQLSDRLAVIYEGEFMAVVDPDEVTEEQLGLLMAGEEPADVPRVESTPASGGEPR